MSHTHLSLDHYQGFKEVSRWIYTNEKYLRTCNLDQDLHVKILATLLFIISNWKQFKCSVVEANSDTLFGITCP